MLRLRLLCSLAACLVIAGAFAAGAAGSPGLAALSAAPRVPQGAQAIGALSASSPVAGAVVLQPRDGAALEQFIAAVGDPHSTLFHDYLPPGAFADRYGPTAATIGAVRTELESNGLDVTGVSRDGLFVHFKGTASTVERAFHVGFERYRLSDGSTGQQTTSAPLLPATLARSVAAVVGLDNLVRAQPLGLVRPPRSTWGTRTKAIAGSFPHPPGSPTACAAASAAAQSFGGLTDDQIANAYGAFGLYGAGDEAAGQHIALYELEPFLRSDIQVFDTCYFGATQASKMLARLRVVPVDGGQPAGTGSGEALLDVEDLEALAPGASVDVYTGPSPSADGVEYDPVDEYAAMVNDDKDQVISTSWGLCEQSVQDGQPGLQEAENLLFEQAAAQGQTIFSAAGDSGSDDCSPIGATSPAPGQNPLAVDDPSAQPDVVAVGGTSIDDASTEPPVEQVWNDGASGGAGGGGISQSWTMPAWERQARVPGIPMPGSADYANAAGVEKSFGFPTNFCQSNVSGATASTPCRVLPDVSSQADEFTGAITVYQAAFGGWGPTGGTSSATPIWAAMLADVNASSTCAANAATHDGVGFANPLLYAVASNPGEYPAAFNDVTEGNNDIYGIDNGLVFPATGGYDLASGLGSPRLTGPGGTAGLAEFLCALGASANRPFVSGLSPASGSVAGGEKITISGSGFEAAGKPDVAAVEVGGAQLAAGSFTVDSSSSISATLPPASTTRPPHSPAPQDGAGPADVIVVLRDGATSAPNPSSTFQYVDVNAKGAVPSVTGVLPIGGAETAPGAVTILGSGFVGATHVTFGGRPAASYTVDGPNRITATPPTYSGATACSPLPSTGVYKGENATNDICQVQVTVANGHGTSATGHIRPPLEGAISLNVYGDLVAPPGCGCEIAPAATEYDYLPLPKVTSASTAGGPASLASESSPTVITVHGVGLNPLTVEWADFGNPALGSSIDTGFVYETGTEIQIIAPTQPLTVGPVNVPFSVKTLAGQSAPVSVTYAGVPTVSGVINETNSTQLHGIYGVPDTGRTPLQITGAGFAGQLIAPIDFADESSGNVLATQFSFSVASASVLNTESVGQVPALDEVQLCTVSGCSSSPPADELHSYAPGDPRVTSVSPSSGPAAGGTKVVIDGDNLGCAIGVFFGTTGAKSFSRVPAALDCGATTAVDATSPPGTAASSVPVTVETVESYFTGSGRGTSSASFTYK